MKIEWLAHRTARHGLSVKDRLMGALPAIAPWASRVPGLANLRNRLPWARRLGERWFGIAAARSLPAWRRDTFWHQRPRGLASRDKVLRAAAAGDKAVVLFVDTFNGFFDSENARAAVHVLQAAGYLVHAVHKGHRQHESAHCCGRTLLASGQVDAAKGRLGALIDALLPFVKAKLPVVGLEPSCLLTLRDEALVMGFGDKAEQIANASHLFEEFVAAELRAGRFALKLKPAERPILLHGHCHQKAFGAVEPILQVLRLIPGAQPSLIETSCCGMAGSFGYEAKHHAVSMQMAEAALLPAIRAQPDAMIVADGTSCRHQIADGAQREALHVARLLEMQLA